MAHLSEAAVAKINEICDRYADERTPLMMILSDVQKEYDVYKRQIRVYSPGGAGTGFRTYGNFRGGNLRRGNVLFVFLAESEREIRHRLLFRHSVLRERGAAGNR